MPVAAEPTAISGVERLYLPDYRPEQISRMTTANTPHVTDLQSDALVRELRTVVQRGRRRWRLLILLEAVGMTVALTLGYLWLVFLADNLLHLPIWGRALASGVFVVGAVYLLTRLVRQWKRAAFTEDQVAFAIEQHTEGGIENRLINALQLARDGSHHDKRMSQAVVAENYDYLKRVRLRQASESRPALIRLGVAAALIAVGVGFWMLEPERFSNAARRIFQPFASVAPIYDTVLRIEPGDITADAGQDVVVTVHIDGRVPRHLTLLLNDAGERKTDRVDLAGEQPTATYTFESVDRSLTYAVRGGDYTTRYYTITVPMPVEVRRVTGVYDYPDYTQLPDESVDSVSGDLQAVRGTRAQVRFALNQPVTRAALLLVRGEGDAATTQRVALDVSDDRHAAGAFAFDGAVGYSIEADTVTGTKRSRQYTLVAADDREPTLRLSGIEHQSEVMIDGVSPVSVGASDDYGLAEVGLFYRRVGSDGKTADAAGTWAPVETWPVTDAAREFAEDAAVSFGMLDAVEGESIEFAARGRDHYPERSGRWTTGPSVTVTISGDGARLQLIYEQILRGEAALRELLAKQKTQETTAGEWMDKLSLASGLRWDDKKNLDALAIAMREQAAAQAALREATAHAARQMPDLAGTLKMSVAMLADTEMVRAIRQVEAVPNRDAINEKRGALAEARLTYQRTARSLSDVLDRYVVFREDWELAHMLAFTKMLSDRQLRMAEGSRTYARLSAGAVTDVQRTSVSRRQEKLLELSTLAEGAFGRMAQREHVVGPEMATAFLNASESFEALGVKTLMRDAGAALEAGQWAASSELQKQAGEALAIIYRDVREAQSAAAQAALDDLKDLAESNVDEQEDPASLKQGMAAGLVDLDEEQLNLEEIIHLRELAAEARRRQNERGDDKSFDYMFEEHMKSLLGQRTDKKQEFDNLKLATRPSGQMSMPNSSDREGNRVQANVQEEFEDLVGDLLEEADDLRDDYETYNLNTAWGINEAGEIGKQGGDLNSTAAASATGNMKPPTQDFGGATRSGRQGARAHGLSVGSESINRRGRDEVQEGQEDIPSQAGTMKETLSSDPQEDTATGTGGKAVGEEQGRFSDKDAGEFKEEQIENMREPSPANQIVERQGKPLDPRVAEMMRDLESNQAQVIQRIKAIRKKLDQLYLPTDHLDDIMAQLTANLDRFEEAPDGEIFRKQIELLDQLKATVVVFNQAGNEFEQSLQRDQRLRGQVLDESATPAMPGYEDATRAYYEKLSGI